MSDMDKDMVIPVISVDKPWHPPEWALLERTLFDTLNQVAVEFVERYTRPDGTLIWRQDWPGLDGSDDPYEGFMNLALLYVLGGGDHLLPMADRLWDAITWQWTEYGQVHREFDAYYDWMHHGEGYLFLYFLGLADPGSLKGRQRAAKFAAMYTGDDELAQNYDKEKRLIRSPLTGSRGPRFTVTEEDWCTHRGILDGYLAPFEDLDGVDFASERCPWSDDGVYREILDKMNERMTRGDVPLNLNATTLLAHAYLFTQDGRYRDWVIDYLKGWEERTANNAGIVPDNVGLSGATGEYNDGKWWGGYYGWRWPHGYMTIMEPIVNACMNALLLSGDMASLQLARQQLDWHWSQGKDESGVWKVPYKRFDAGWADYRTPNPLYPIYLWTVSMADEDLERVRRLGRHVEWSEVIVPGVSGRDKSLGRETKHYIGNTLSWFEFIQGRFVDYPTHILEANLTLIRNQVRKMRSVAGDPHAWSDRYNVDDFSSIHAWQEMCPVYFEGLAQLTLGGPMHISHGGLQHGRFRYFDPSRRRPGLPEDVAALVDELADERASVTLVNVSSTEAREVVVQAGVFGEHDFQDVKLIDEDGNVLGTEQVRGKWAMVRLAPGAGVRMEWSMRRYVRDPTYAGPWDDAKVPEGIRGRQQTLV